MNNFNAISTLVKRNSDLSISLPAKIQRLKEKSLPKIELVKFIKLLFQLHCNHLFADHPPRTIDELANRIECLKEADDSQGMSHLAGQVDNLINNQFGNPIVEALRELITNALDAQARAATTHEPINIVFENTTLTISDHGDGIGADKLPHLFVPGISSNSTALFNPSDTIKGNTGMFGQGALSALQLIMPGNKLSIHLNVNQTATVECEMIIDGVPHHVTNTVGRLNEENNLFLAQPINSGKKPKIVVQSNNIDPKSDPIKIKIVYENTSHSVIVKKLPFSGAKGTSFTIRSTKLDEKSVREAVDYFKFIDPSKPIYLNEKWINPPPSGYKTLFFVGGRLLCKTDASPDNETGKLRIAEKGRKILELDCRGPGIFNEVVLDFDYLQQSQDRSTVNWNDTRVRECLANVADAICADGEFTAQQKIDLFNSLCSLPKHREGDVKTAFHSMIKGYENRLLPNTLAFRDLVKDNEKYLFINEYGIDEIKAFEKADWKGCDIYLLDSPRSICNRIPFGDKDCYFFDKNLFPEPHTSGFLIMAHMIKFWIDSANYEQWQCAFNSRDYILNGHQITLNNKRSADLDFRTPPIGKLEESSPSLTMEDSFTLFDPIPPCPHQSTIKMVLSPLSESIIRSGIVGSDMDELDDEDRMMLILAGNRLIEGAAVLSHAFPLLNAVHLGLYLDLLAATAGHHVLMANCNLETAKDLFRKDGDEILAFLELQDSETRLRLALQFLIYNTINAENTFKFKNLIKRAVAFIQIGEICPEFFFKNEHRLSDSIEDNVTTTDEIYRSMQLGDLKAHSPIAMFSSYPPDVLDEVRQFFKRFPFDFIDRLLKLFSSMNNQDSESEILFDPLELFRKLMSYPPELAEFIFGGAPSQFALYASALRSTREKSANIEPTIAFDLPYEIVKNIYDLIYSSKSIPELAKSDLKDIFLHTYFMTLLIKGSVDPTRLIHALQMFLAIAKINPGTLLVKNDLLKILELCCARKDFLEQNPLGGTLASYEDVKEHLQKNEVALQAISDDLTKLMLDGICYSDSPQFNIPCEWKLNAAPLECDPDVIEAIGSNQKARQEIAGAIRQNNSGYHLVINELIRNSIDAESDRIKIDTHKDDAGKFYVMITDNGTGMNEQAFKALKIPHLSAKNHSSQHSKNFGTGFFSIFSTGAFDEAYVITKDSSGKTRTAYFCKEQDSSILFHSKFFQDDKELINEQGTKIILIKRCGGDTVDVESWCFSSEAQNAASEVTRASILLNGFELTNQDKRVIASVTMDYPGAIDRSTFTITAAYTESGIFRDNLRIGPVDKLYHYLLPDFIEHYLQSNKIGFKIFLPPVVQNMTRSSIVNSNDLVSAIQHGILWASIKTIGLTLSQHALRKDSLFIPCDYWFNLRSYNFSPSQKTKSLIHSYSELATGPLDLSSQKALLAIHNLFFQENQARLTLPQMLCDKEVIGHRIEAYFSPLIYNENHLEYTQDLKSTVKFMPTFGDMLINLPLHETSSIKSLRNEIIITLKACGILNANGEYSDDVEFFNLNDFSDANYIVRQELSLIIQKYKNTPLDGYIRLFIYQISYQIWNLSQKIENDTKDLSTYEPIGKFLQVISKKVLGKEITYKIEKLNKDRYAHTYRGTNCIHLNISMDPFQHLMESLKMIYKGEESFTGSIPHLERIANALYVLSHEIAHMEEPKETPFTHDKTFFKSVQIIYEQFMVRVREDSLILSDAIKEALFFSEETEI